MKPACLYRYLVSIAIISALTGCGSESTTSRNVDAGYTPLQKVPTYPVSGTVLYQGKPAPGAWVQFRSIPGSNQTHFGCEVLTNSEGKYVCETYQEGDGLPAGTYDVRITLPVTPMPDYRDGETDRLNGRYNSPQKAPFRVVVKAGPNVIPPFQLR